MARWVLNEFDRPNSQSLNTRGSPHNALRLRELIVCKIC
jgi:hypothetical protein